VSDRGEPAAVALRRRVNGFQVSQAIHVAATLGIADLLADGPRSSDEFAADTGADEDALYRLLRALAAVGVFREDEDRRFAQTELGEGLRSDASDGIAGWAKFVGRPVPDAGALLVIERLLGPPNADAVAKLSDLNMLVAAGGRERNLDEFETLLAAAGFRLVGATPTASGLSVIEGAVT
jgi:hypothetical protein